MALSGGIIHPTLYKKGVTGVKDYWDAFNTQIDTGLDLLNQLSALHLSPPYQAWHFSVCGNSYAVNKNWFGLWYFTPLITAMWLRKLTILLKLRQSTSRSLLGALWPVLVCVTCLNKWPIFYWKSFFELWLQERPLLHANHSKILWKMVLSKLHCMLPLWLQNMIIKYLVVHRLTFNKS